MRQRADPLIGEVLTGTYRIIVAIKKGGMGVVYEAENARLPNVRYAVKVLRPKWARDAKNFATNYARFEREAEIISSLRHPHIVAVLDFNKTEEGYPFLVMELLEGEDLQKKLKREGKLRPQEVCLLMRQVGSALQLAHNQGVVHRDLKPSNIYLATSVEGVVLAKLLDFGISKSVDSPKKVTVEHQVVLGTAAYMAPEQARGAVQEIDHLSDIFSLATVVYRCLTGEAPFTGASDTDIRYNVCFADPPPVGVLLPSLPPRIDEVLRRAHSKRKEDRYQRVQEFVDEFTRALDETSIDADVLYAEDDITGPPHEITRSHEITRPPRRITEPRDITGPREFTEPPDITGPIPSDPEPTVEVRGRSWIFWAAIAFAGAVVVLVVALVPWRDRTPSAKAALDPTAVGPKAALDPTAAGPKASLAPTPTSRPAPPPTSVPATPVESPASLSVKPMETTLRIRKVRIAKTKHPIRARKRPVEPRPRAKAPEAPPKPKKKIYYFDDV